MMGRDADVLMRGFIQAEGAAGEEFLAELLSAHAEPQVRHMVSQRLAAAGVAEKQDVDDLCGEVLAELLYRLRQIKENPNGSGIENFSSYAAAATYRAYSDYLRRKYPHRHRLKTQLRYLLQTDTRFDIWEISEHLWLCGLSRWNHSTRAVRKTLTLEEVSQLSADLSIGSPADHPADFVAALLNRLAAPVELNDMVGLVAQLWGVQDRSAVELKEIAVTRSDEGGTTSKNMEFRQWLGDLWREVACLPLNQRHALLLNLREEGGGSALMLVPLAGVASISEIAEVLQMRPDDLAAFWNQLPIDDLTIAARLGITRQQVINLRKSARARLTRRMSSTQHGW